MLVKEEGLGTKKLVRDRLNYSSFDRLCTVTVQPFERA